MEDPRAISISSFDTADGWTEAEIKGIRYESSPRRATVELKDAPSGNLLRVIVKGTGPRPVLTRARGGEYVPLAGAVGGPPSGAHEGRDFVHMFRIRS